MKTIALKLVAIITILSFSIFLANCKKDEPKPRPVITSFTPTSALAGTQVTITGSNFKEDPSSNVVMFNGKPAMVNAATTTQLVTIVPTGASTGKITVTVNGSTGTSDTDFTVLTTLPAPTITSFAPAHAVAGATVTITGTNFIAGNLTLNKVKINNTDAIVTAATATQLTITVPAATTGLVTVEVNGESTVSISTFEVLLDIPRTGLVAFYPFSGDANDVSGNNLNGTPTNGPTLTSDRFATANHAYNFDGTNDYITMGNPPLLQISNVITVSGWINITAFRASHNPSIGAMEIIKKLYNDPAAGFNPTKGFRFMQDFFGSGEPSFLSVIYSSARTTLTQYTGTYLGNTPLTVGDWIFFAMVIDNKSLKFYHNGVLVDNFTQANNIMDDGTLGDWIISDNQYFNGKIDDVAIYNRALSAADITQLYQQTVTKY